MMGHVYKTTNSGKVIPVEGVEIAKDDFGTLCICALRYCHGRHTYMPELVQSIVKAHFKDLSDRDLGVIADDRKAQEIMDSRGYPFDQTDWLNFYEALEKYRRERDA